MCIAPNAASETAAIDLPQRINAGIISLLANLPVVITVAIVEAGLAVLSPPTISAAFSGSSFWHGRLTSNSTGPEPDALAHSHKWPCRL
jgi:hypothetical protein